MQEMGRELFKQNMVKKLAKKPEILERRTHPVFRHCCILNQG